MRLHQFFGIKPKQKTIKLSKSKPMQRVHLKEAHFILENDLIVFSGNGFEKDSPLFIYEGNDKEENKKIPLPVGRYTLKNGSILVCNPQATLDRIIHKSKKK